MSRSSAGSSFGVGGGRLGKRYTLEESQGLIVMIKCRVVYKHSENKVSDEETFSVSWDAPSSLAVSHRIR